MRALSDDVRESCHLTVLQGNQVLVLTQEESPTRSACRWSRLHPFAAAHQFRAPAAGRAGARRV
jgi:DNA-binding IclR family transcriptional regulator